MGAEPTITLTEREPLKGERPMGINPKTDSKLWPSIFRELGKQLLNSVIESITPSEEELIKAHQEEVG